MATKARNKRVSTRRTERLEARVSAAALRRIRKAAELQGCSLSSFVVAAAEQAAAQALRPAKVIQLSREDSELIARAILNPRPIAPALRRAAESRRRMVEPI